MYAPLPASTKLIQDINKMVLGPRNDVLCKSILRQATKLEESGFYVDAQQVRGMVAQVQGDLDAMHRYFKASCLASGQSVITMLNYAVALSNMLQYDDASAMCIDLIRRAPDDVAVVRQALHVFADASDLRRAQEAVRHLEKIGERLKADDEKALDMLIRKNEVFAAVGASADEFNERLRFVLGLLSTAGHPARQQYETVLDGETLMCEFPLDEDDARLCELDALIQDELSGLPFLPIDRVAVFTCTRENTH